MDRDCLLGEVDVLPIQDCYFSRPQARKRPTATNGVIHTSRELPLPPGARGLLYGQDFNRLLVQNDFLQAINRIAGHVAAPNCEVEEISQIILIVAPRAQAIAARIEPCFDLGRQIS